MRRACVAFSLLCGCGRIGFGDVARDGRVGGEAGFDGASIDAGLPVLGPFGTPSAVAELNSGTCEKGVTFTDDLLEIFWDSDRTPTLGIGDIWTATRATPTSAWGTPVHVIELSSANDEDSPRVRGDGLVIYIAQPAAGNNNIYRSTRPTRADAWSTPQLVPELNSTTEEFGPWLSADETVAVFESYRTGPSTIWMSTRASAATAWATPTSIGELGGSAGSPWLDPSRRVIYFTHTMYQGLRVATRTSTSGTFGPAVDLGELGVTAGDEWLSPDLSTIFYTDNCNLMTATR